MAEHEIPPHEDPKVRYRPRALAPEMGLECYMIRWDDIPYLFSSKEIARASIEATYPGLEIVESETHEMYGLGGPTSIFDVMRNEFIQDRIAVFAVSVRNEPITFPRHRGGGQEF